MKTLVFLLLIAYAYAQSQDLCGARVNPSQLQFVDDPAACDAYLFCFYGSDDAQIEVVYQGRCPSGANFNNGACDFQHTCTAECEFNTGSTRVAVDSDTECKSFIVCEDDAPGTIVSECPGTSVFNRNFGACTPASRAPCEGSTGGGPNPPGGANCEADDVMINDDSACEAYFFCQDGTAVSDTCPGGLHFNPDKSHCDDPDQLDPPCLGGDERIQSVYGPEIPKPPVINAPPRRFLRKSQF